MPVAGVTMKQNNVSRRDILKVAVGSAAVLGAQLY